MKKAHELHELTRIKKNKKIRVISGYLFFIRLRATAHAVMMNCHENSREGIYNAVISAKEREEKEKKHKEEIKKKKRIRVNSCNSWASSF